MTFMGFIDPRRLSSDGRYGEDHMKIFNWAEIFTASLDPLFLGQGLAIWDKCRVPAGVIRYLQNGRTVLGHLIH